MKKSAIYGSLLGLLLISFFAAQSAFAADARETKEFADKHIILQISDPNPFKQTLVLNVAGNILKAYGSDKVEIEIVAFGPGLRLLFADNSNKGRIKSLSDNGVRFSACDNTYAAVTKQLGKAPKLNSSAVHVSAGVVRIVELVEKGYILVKP